MKHKFTLIAIRNLIIVLSIFSFATCENIVWDCDNYEFDDCTLDEPYEAELLMKISIEAEYDSIQVVLFKGMIEDKDTVDNFFAEYDEYYIWLDIDKEYSAIAKYYIGNQVITVLDGDKLRTRLTSRCEESCYIIKGDELDLQLEYPNLK